MQNVASNPAALSPSDISAGDAPRDGARDGNEWPHHPDVELYTRHLMNVLDPGSATIPIFRIPGNVDTLLRVVDPFHTFFAMLPRGAVPGRPAPPFTEPCIYHRTANGVTAWMWEVPPKAASLLQFLIADETLADFAGFAPRAGFTKVARGADERRMTRIVLAADGGAVIFDSEAEHLNVNKPQWVNYIVSRPSSGAGTAFSIQWHPGSADNEFEITAPVSVASTDTKRWLGRRHHSG